MASRGSSGCTVGKSIRAASQMSAYVTQTQIQQKRASGSKTAGEHTDADDVGLLQLVEETLEEDDSQLTSVRVKPMIFLAPFVGRVVTYETVQLIV